MVKINIREIGDRGVLFTFEDETAVYLINSDKRLFLCDTHLGPMSMEIVKSYIKEHGWSGKELIVFNSHSDWDHIWGNCAFVNQTIIGHVMCRERMLERSRYDLEMLPMEYRRGNVEIRLPDLTFDSRMIFEEDEVEFIYAPGHTVCSSICWDKRDSTLFTGDLVEEPMPYVIYEGIEDFVKSLELIKSIQAKTVVTAHSGIAEEKLIDNNIAYIKSICNNKPLSFEDEGDKLMHQNNLKRLLMLRYEKAVKERLGKNFDYKAYKFDFWRSMNIKEDSLRKEYQNMKEFSYEELEKGLTAFINTL